MDYLLICLNRFVHFQFDIQILNLSIFFYLFFKHFDFIHISLFGFQTFCHWISVFIFWFLFSILSFRFSLLNTYLSTLYLIWLLHIERGQYSIVRLNIGEGKYYRCTAFIVILHLITNRSINIPPLSKRGLYIGLPLSIRLSVWIALVRPFVRSDCPCPYVCLFGLLLSIMFLSVRIALVHPFVMII